MRINRGRTLFASVVIGLGLSVAACGSSGDDDGSSGSNESVEANGDKGSGEVANDKEKFEKGLQSTSSVLSRGSSEAQEQQGGQQGLEEANQGLGRAEQHQRSGDIPSFQVDCKQGGSTQFSGSYEASRSEGSTYKLNAQFNGCQEDGVQIDGNLAYNFSFNISQQGQQQGFSGLEFSFKLAGQLDYSGDVQGQCGYDLKIETTDSDSSSSAGAPGSGSTGTTGAGSGMNTPGFKMTGSACGYNGSELEDLDVSFSVSASSGAGVGSASTGGASGGTGSGGSGGSGIGSGSGSSGSTTTTTTGGSTIGGST